MPRAAQGVVRHVECAAIREHRLVEAQIKNAWRNGGDGGEIRRILRSEGINRHRRTGGVGRVEPPLCHHAAIFCRLAHVHDVIAHDAVGDDGERGGLVAGERRIRFRLKKNLRERARRLAHADQHPTALAGVDPRRRAFNIRIAAGGSADQRAATGRETRPLILIAPAFDRAGEVPERRASAHGGVKHRRARGAAAGVAGEQCGVVVDAGRADDVGRPAIDAVVAERTAAADVAAQLHILRRVQRIARVVPKRVVIDRHAGVARDGTEQEQTRAVVVVDDVVREGDFVRVALVVEADAVVFGGDAFVPGKFAVEDAEVGTVLDEPGGGAGGVEIGAAQPGVHALRPPAFDVEERERPRLATRHPRILKANICEPAFVDGRVVKVHAHPDADILEAAVGNGQIIQNGRVGGTTTGGNISADPDSRSPRKFKRRHHSDAAVCRAPLGVHVLKITARHHDVGIAEHFAGAVHVAAGVTQIDADLGGATIHAFDADVGRILPLDARRVGEVDAGDDRAWAGAVGGQGHGTARDASPGEPQSFVVPSVAAFQINRRARAQYQSVEIGECCPRIRAVPACGGVTSAAGTNVIRGSHGYSGGDDGWAWPVR